MVASLSPAAGVIYPNAAALALVPGLQGGARPLKLQPLVGGSVNASWDVVSSQGRFVLRMDGVPERTLGVDRAREHAAQGAAAAAGHAARIVAVDLNIGARVCEYLPGRVWTADDFTDLTAVVRLGACLARVHALPVPDELRLFDPVAHAREYVRRVDPMIAAAHDLAATMTELQNAAARVTAAALASGVPARIIHGDLAHGNVVEDAGTDGSPVKEANANKTGVRLLDWEYAQLAPPLYDIGCILAYYPQAGRHTAQLLAASGFGDGDGDGVASRYAQALPAATYVYQVLTWLWLLARGQGGSAPCVTPG